MSYETNNEELLDRPLRDFVTRTDLAAIHGVSEAAISTWIDPLLENRVIIGKRLYLYVAEEVKKIKRKKKGRRPNLQATTCTVQ